MTKIKGKITQKRLSELSGKKPSFISAVLNKKKTCPDDLLEIIHKEYDPDFKPAMPSAKAQLEIMSKDYQLLIQHNNDLSDLVLDLQDQIVKWESLVSKVQKLNKKILRDSAIFTPMFLLIGMACGWALTVSFGG